LANENQFIKYSRYAIGEILLVVVGILIALQVNNWNEERKDRLIEIKTLKEIKSNLKLDLEEIRNDIDGMDRVVASMNNLESIKEQEDVQFENAGGLRVRPHFEPNKSGYELLTAKGVDIVTNDSLRNRISLLYERTYPYYNKYETEYVQFHALRIMPALLKYFDMDFDPDAEFRSIIFIDEDAYESFRNDQSIAKLLRGNAFEITIFQHRAKWVEAEIVALMKQIDIELDSLKN
jgi:hypothetical protein